MNTRKLRKTTKKITMAPAGGKKQAVQSATAMIAAMVEELRPTMASHGGDVEFVSYKSGTVSLRFTGTCASCQHANVTLMEIARRVREKVKTAKKIKLV